ncbi:MAG: fibronectin type III domain-containing protein, partial [Bacteroidota bacterium]
MAQKIEKEGNLDRKAQYTFERLKNPVTGEIPVDIRTKELTYVLSNPSLQKSREERLLKAASWSRRGPFNVGGRTRALAIDRTNENIILAGGVSGGMWRSTNGGASWTQTTGSSQLHSVTDVYQDPNNTNVWYYVTGEIVGNSASGGSAPYRGNGVFKSTDGGVTWVNLPSTTADPTVFTGGLQYSLRVRVDPTNSDVYVAAFDGIYRSTDGGVSFSNVLSGPSARYTDIEISATGVIYATLASLSTGNEGVFRSTNGTSWTNITPALASGYQRIVLDIAPSNENILYVFANTPGAGKNDHQVFYTSNSGSSWSNRTTNLPAFGGVVGNLGQGSYNQYIKIKPDNPNVVFIGSLNLYRTTNGFTSNGANTWIGGYSPANNVSSYQNHHPDNHSLVFYPSNPNRMLTGHDGGISRTENNLANNGGTFPVSWTFLNNGYYTTQAYGIAIDPETANDGRLMAGFQDNGKWTATSFSGTSAWFEEVAGGDGCYVAIVAGENTRYTSTQNGNVLRVRGANISNPSDVDGIQPSAASGQLFVNPFILDKSDQNIMYYPAGDRIWRNTNLNAINSGFTFGGTNTGWSNLSGSDAGGSQITALDVSKNNAAHVLYYGTSDGKLFRLNNANTSTSTAANITNASFPSGAYVSGIAVDPSNSANVMVVFSNYQVRSIFYSTNSGASWTDVSGNLEQNPDGSGNGPSVQWAEIHRDSNGGVTYLVGTSTGLYSTETLSGTATTWTQEGPNLIGNVPVVMIEGRSSDNLVAVGTHGVGMFSAVVTAAASGCGVPSSLSSSNVSESSATLSWGNVSGANSYDVRYRVQGTSAWTNQNGVSGTSTTISGLAGGTTYEFQVRANCSGSTSNYSGSSTFATASPACISNFPYNESFETGFGGWTQSSNDDIDFTRRSGTTPSNNTGPSGASDGSTYIYVEASNPNFPSREAIIESPCFDLTSLSNPNLVFDYHMFGSQINSLVAEVSTNGGASWTQIFSRSGDQGNNWFTETIALSAFQGANVSFRFIVTTGASSSNGWQSDIALDNIKVESGAPTGGNCITAFPYAESFEADFGGWVQSGSDDIDFTRRSGTTPSGNTGPSGANDGSIYIYVEASNPNFPSRVAILESPCFDLTGLSNPNFIFDYHMFGSQINSLVAEVSTNGGSSWTQIFSESGDQGNNWLSTSIDVSVYQGADVSFRFIVTTGASSSNGWQSDIALDNV